MGKTGFDSFIKESFVTDDYKLKGHFLFENNQIYIISDNYKILFKFHYEDYLYQVGIELAKQLLDVTEKYKDVE